jgi:hypothetical protein
LMPLDQLATRAALLHDAISMLRRAENQRQWDCCARDYAWRASERLREAGLPEVAAQCEDMFGCDFETVLGEIEREIRK